MANRVKDYVMLLSYIEHNCVVKNVGEYASTCNINNKQCKPTEGCIKHNIELFKLDNRFNVIYNKVKVNDRLFKLKQLLNEN